MSLISWKPTRRQILAIAISFFLIWVFIMEFGVLTYTKGVWVFPQDDAYIRMSIAKNFAFYHVWGVSRFEFSPASSSILYPIVLAGLYIIFGSHLVISFIVNLAAAIVLLILVQKWLNKEAVYGWPQLWILIGFIVLVPLPVMVVIGMEHVLQILFSFLFIYSFCDWFNMQNDKNDPIPVRIFIYGLFVCATRYEGLFLVFIACLFLLSQKRWISFLTLGIVSILPLVIFGIYSWSKGGYPLPNPVIIKSLPIPFDSDGIKKFFDTDIVNKLFFTYPSRGGVCGSRLLFIIPILFGLFWKPIQERLLYRYVLFFCLGITILHLVFANTIFFYRYEGYLIGCCIPIAGVLIARCAQFSNLRKNVAGMAISIWTIIVLGYPYLDRSWDAYKDTGKGCINMYEQDYLAAQFLHRYYYRKTMVVNDLGAISYLTQGQKIDLDGGIGNMDIARSKVESYFRPEYLQHVVTKNHPEIAVVQESRSDPWLLQKWQKIGYWHTYNTLPRGDRFIWFYAIDTSAAPELIKSLKEFEPRLPAGVKAGYNNPTVMK